MRFNSPEEVRAWCEHTAAGDIMRHRFYGIDLNPFCTDGARHQWERGYRGDPPHSWEDQTLWFDTIYQRGAACNRLLTAEAQRYKEKP